MTPTSERAARQIGRVLSATTDNFVELVQIAGLDPAEDFRNIRLTDVDFAHCDLSAFDFSNTHFQRCSFRHARIKRACFDRCEFVHSDLAEAIDWGDASEPEPRRGWWQRTFGDGTLREVDAGGDGDSGDPTAASSPDRSIRPRTIAKGVITTIGDKSVRVDIGLPDRSRVPLDDFTADERAALQVGQSLNFYVIGHVPGKPASLSRERARREAAWDAFEARIGSGTLIQGVIVGRVNGGYSVDVGEVIAFLPRSHLDIRPRTDVAALMHVPQSFRILKQERYKMNLVVSRRALLEEAREMQRDELFQTLRAGQWVKGTVSRTVDFGAFVDLGGFEGLLHTSAYPEGHKDGATAPVVGERVSVQIVAIDKHRGRISLSMKHRAADVRSEDEDTG